MRYQGTTRVNKRGHLEIGGCDVVELAAKFGTPLYIIDESLFRHNCRKYFRAFKERHGAEVIYAGKTLLTTAICRMVEEEGLGLDVVSGGELYTALKAGFPPDKIYFHGNNKSADELKMGLEAGLGRFMVDNPHELAMLNSLAGAMHKRARVILRLTPGIEAHTHSYIKTGQIDSKFGLPLVTGQARQAVLGALAMNNIILTGLHCHIGSQIFELESYIHAVQVMMDFAGSIYRETGWQPREMDLGGGLGIYYTDEDTPCSIDEYADLMAGALSQMADRYGMEVPTLLVEPGRSISGPAGSTAYTVGAVKDIPGVRKYVAVDGGMGDNPRHALYQSRYEACLANKASLEAQELVSVAGKCCESGDMLIKDIKLPRSEPGDILTVSCTGAYNYSMSMNYNRLPRPAMVLVQEGRADLILRRETYQDITKNDMLPPRLIKRKMAEMASGR